MDRTALRKHDLHEHTSDFSFWQQKSPQERLQALEDIRQEYHQWKYGTEPRLQRVYCVIKPS